MVREENALHRCGPPAPWLRHQARHCARKNADSPGKPAHWMFDTLEKAAIWRYAGNRLEVAFPMQNLQRSSCR
jgi:hypothetical protein